MPAYFVIFVYLFISLFSGIKSKKVEIVETFGCKAYKRLIDSIKKNTASADCFFPGVELQPEIYYKKHANVLTINDCKSLCSKQKRCVYFTLIQSKTSPSASTCYLKTKPDYSTSPVLTIRTYNTTESEYQYTSGSLDGCSNTCEDEEAVSYGCQGSTPTTCKAFGLTFSKNCLFLPKQPGCLYDFESYQCCRKTSDSYSGVNQYFHTEKLLSGGTTIQAFVSGITSAEHCYTLCLKSPECTDWNFVVSKTTSYIGGACYLKKFADKGQRREVDVPKYVTSIIGYDCDKLGHCKVKSQYIPSQVITGEYVQNSECFFKQLTFAHTLKIIHSSMTPEECQKHCQNAQGCTYFLHRNHQCQLSYSIEGYKTTTENTIVGPKYCGAEAKAYTGCALIGKEYTGDYFNAKDPSTYAVSATVCHQICRSNQRCVAWSYTYPNCTSYTAVTTTIDKAKSISAPTTCDFESN